MRRINHLLPLKIRYGFSAIGALIIIGKIMTHRLIIEHDVLSSLFHSYYLLSLGVLFLLIGLFTSEQALDRIFGDDKTPRVAPGDPSPGMGVKKDSILGEATHTHGDGGSGSGD